MKHQPTAGSNTAATALWSTWSLVSASAHTTPPASSAARTTTRVPAAVIAAYCGVLYVTGRASGLSGASFAPPEGVRPLEWM
jgi:hypothetical protein